MTSHVTPDMVAMVYEYTVITVSLMLAGGGIGFAIGTGAVCADAIECMVRQPDTRPILIRDTFIFTGLVGNFPFIILAFAAWFLFANPIVGALDSTVAIESNNLVAPAPAAANTAAPQSKAQMLEPKVKAGGKVVAGKTS